MKSLDLFVGAGGLAMGISRAGFSHEAVVELDADACRTIRENQRRGVNPLAEWLLVESDVRHMDFSQYANTIDVLSGGPPCQPFSLGGKHGGHRDGRNLFPEVFRAVRETRPRAVIVENVKGLLRSSFSKYFEYIYLQLSYPELMPHSDEPWTEHLARLERHHTSGDESGLYYRVVFRLLNAANYGVPQRRERVIIVALRGDLGVEWTFPQSTHSLEALLWDQWISGEYWERHRVPLAARGEPAPRVAARLARLRANGKPGQAPWLTVREALSDLPEPSVVDAPGILNHRHNPGARQYPGHTGSPLDEPAKTLKAGGHGVPGGENMLLLPNGDVRYFTLREAARLQTFPDDYFFPTSWTESMRQLGNAVPVRLAHCIAAAVGQTLGTVAAGGEHV